MTKGQSTIYETYA